MMKICDIAMLVCCLGATVGRAGDSMEISAYPMDRYQTMLEKSPFAKETLVETQIAGPLFGQDLVLIGHFRLGETVYALLLNRKTQERITANSAESRSDRPKVISLSIDANPIKTTALVQLGVEKANIGFDSQSQPKKSDLQSEPKTTEGDVPATPKAESNVPTGDFDSGGRMLPRLRPIVPAAAPGSQ